MLVPLSWLLEYAALPEPADAREVARRLTAIGLEIEGLEQVGHDISSVVVAEVLEIEELSGHKKPIRYCRVGTGGSDGERWVICGAVNFAVGDRVPLALPGARLPGGFEIGSSKRYGLVSDGMIASPAELALGDDHTGIMVLPQDAPLGADFVGYAGLRDVVLDVNVTPDKGHALSIRGMARELATAFGAAYTDPADAGLPAWAGDPGPPGAVHGASIDDPTACDRFALREVRGIDPGRPTPLPIRVRLARADTRSVSLPVDVTNYLMLELGQPLHAFDRAELKGPIVVRRARPGERLETLDHVVRTLDPDDIVITDSSGPISLAGTMGGLATEVRQTSTDLVIEAAHFDAGGTARMSRRHRLFSQASARFERGVDYELPLRASAKAVAMLADLGGGSVVPGYTLAAAPIEPVTIGMPADHPDHVAGMTYGSETVISRLRDVGCAVESAASGPDGDVLTVTPPSWRPDLTDPNDLAEEVIRIEGYDKIGIRTPRAIAGKGRTPAQRLRAGLGRALAGAGYVEVTSSPFGSQADLDRLQLEPDDVRRRTVSLANPISDEEPLLRTSLLPGLFRVVNRNTGRGFADLSLFEIGSVARARLGPEGSRLAPILPVDRRPTDQEIASLDEALPDQPRLVAIVLAGQRGSAGWWGPGRPVSFHDAIEAARTVLRISRVPYTIEAGRCAPWHPGRCAEFVLTPPAVEPVPIGYAGELHPRVIAAYRLAPRACAVELDLSAIERVAAGLPPIQAPVISTYPVATQDVALVVAADVPAAEVQAALVAGATAGEDGAQLEEVRLFDVYSGGQVGPGRKSLAYSLRFRAPDRTLTDEEVAVARDSAVASAVERTGAVLRGGPSAP
jgi:phenylalanyl-tRNA synthetase beta chain